jgi:hypothetical protein
MVKKREIIMVILRREVKMLFKLENMGKMNGTVDRTPARCVMSKTKAKPLARRGTMMGMTEAPWQRI